MATVLLADDDRLFKAVEGTCLRRERCRLIMAPFESLRDTALQARPDLILAPAPAAARQEGVRALLGDPKLSAIPVLLIEFRTNPRAGRPLPDRQGPVELVVVPYQSRGAPDYPALDRLVDAAIRTAMPSLRRRADRLRISVEVRCRGAGLPGTLRTKDVSPSGLFLRTVRSPAPGRRFRVRFELPEDRLEVADGSPLPSVEGVCEIVRSVPAAPGAGDLIPGVGARFVEIGEEGAAALSELVRRRRAASARRTSAVGAG
ncbi:MAG TPA: PilZ domain-containing protein [Candidatus Polarisedimenticolia bacterium]|nr:PilZ domain-containing protein [Candidatus Polarisedimenticolia bacterium]